MPTRPLPKRYNEEDKIEIQVPPPLGGTEQLAEEPEMTYCKWKYFKFNILNNFVIPIYHSFSTNTWNSDQAQTEEENRKLENGTSLRKEEKIKRLYS